MSKNFLPGLLHKRTSFAFMPQKHKETRYKDAFNPHGGTIITHDRQAELYCALILVGAYNTRNNRRKLAVAIRKAR